MLFVAQNQDVVIVLLPFVVGGVPNVDAAGKTVLKDWNRLLHVVLHAV